MSNDKVLYETKDQTAWITLNRPEALNAINEEMRELIIEYCARAEADRTCRWCSSGAPARRALRWAAT